MAATVTNVQKECMKNIYSLQRLGDWCVFNKYTINRPRAVTIKALERKGLIKVLKRDNTGLPVVMKLNGNKAMFYIRK